MKINIIIPYRPLSREFMRTGEGPLHQLPDGRWKDVDGNYIFSGEYRKKDKEKDELVRAIKFLNKNSYVKHNIVVSVDDDVYPNEEYFKQFDNVLILRCTKHIYSPDYVPFFRANVAVIEGINSVPDEEWLCHGYLADLICAKHWDLPIIDAIQQYGENYVYVPMFVEIRSGYSDIPLTGIDPTPRLIWEEWRKLCCHSLLMPMPSKGYFTEDDIDYFINRSNEAGKTIIIERPGDRIYGYFNVLIMKSKFAKKAIRFIGPGCDTDFDARLYSECKLNKAVITRSYVFHPYCEFRRQIEEKNENK